MGWQEDVAELLRLGVITQKEASEMLAWTAAQKGKSMAKYTFITADGKSFEHEMVLPAGTDIVVMPISDGMRVVGKRYYRLDKYRDKELREYITEYTDRDHAVRSWQVAGVPAPLPESSKKKKTDYKYPEGSLADIIRHKVKELKFNKDER